MSKTRVEAENPEETAPSAGTLFQSEVRIGEHIPEDALLAFANKPRSTISGETFNNYCEAVFLFSASALLYFAPRIMELARKNPTEMLDTVIYFAAIFSKECVLTPQRAAIDAIMTDEMRGEIKQFLSEYRISVADETDDPRFYNFLL